MTDDTLILATGGLHPLITAQINEAYAQADRLARIARAAQLTLDKYHLADLLDLATSFYAAQDELWVNVGVYEPSDRHHVYLTIPPSRIPAVRPILHAALDKTGDWDKNYNIEHTPSSPPRLLERWATHSLDKVKHPSTFSTAYDLIILKFLHPVQDGQQISDSCTVQLVEQTTAATTRAELQVVCDAS